MHILLLILNLFMSFSTSFAQTNDLVFKDSLFKKGTAITWSYSELDPQLREWGEPYLYETYLVTKVEGSKVTIEMSSATELNEISPAHHKFTADFKKCKELGRTKRRLNRYRIAFYTKNISKNNKWTALSRRFKSLAFTEKFNCLTEDSKMDFKNLAKDFETLDTAFVWKNYPIKSWYLTDHSELNGIAVRKRAKSFLMKLVKVNDKLIY